MVNNNTNVIVVSEWFTGEILIEKCHEHFMKEILRKPICEKHITKEEKKYPSSAQRMFFFVEGKYDS